MKNSIIGFIILAIIILGLAAYKMIGPGAEMQTVKGFAGGEKAGLLEDEKLRSVLERLYHVKLDWSKAGSMEMVRDTGTDADFLWPSSQTALEAYKSFHGTELVKSEIIFNTPLVFYSWDIVAEAFIKQKIITVRNGVYFITDLPRLFSLVMSGAKWADIGLPDLYGKISIISTDPAKSNSGVMFAGLLANVLCGDTAREKDLDCVLPKLERYFASLGYLEHSSGDLFLQYLSTGVGAKPLIVGYESQIVEFSLQNREQWPSIKEKVRILYPEPTVWSSHPLIILNAKADLLKRALLAPDIQKLAWERHGFRTGMMGAQNDPKVLAIVGIPAQITAVAPMLDFATMERILQTIAPGK